MEIAVIVDTIGATTGVMTATAADMDTVAEAAWEATTTVAATMAVRVAMAAATVATAVEAMEAVTAADIVSLD
jgi:hypothetical protein